MDTFTGKVGAKEKPRLEEIRRRLNADPNSRAVAIIRSKAKGCPRDVVPTLTKYMPEDQRLTFVCGPPNADSVEVWLVPVGASDPEIK